MRLKNSRWTIVMVTVIAFLVLATMVWASPPVTSPSGPLLVPIDAQNAHRVDNHHAASSTASASTRANRVLWAQSNGQLAWKAMPRSALSSRYLNDDRQETIKAGAAEPLLTVNNTGAGQGVRGVSASHDGVVGQSSVAGKSGVYGYNSGSGLGVTGRSINDFGVYAWGKDTSSNDRVGDLLLQGSRGEITTFGNVMNLLSDGNVQIYLDHNNNSANSGFDIWNGTTTNVFRVSENGNMWASGTKSAVVETENHGQRQMYALESPEVWFEEFGTASLVEGVATVPIESIFAETVNLSDYHVFLTPLGDCNGLYVAAKTSTSFEVRELGGGTASIGFDYRFVAKRLGYEEKRLDPAEDPNQLLQEME